MCVDRVRGNNSPILQLVDVAKSRAAAELHSAYEKAISELNLKRRVKDALVEAQHDEEVATQRTKKKLTYDTNKADQIKRLLI
jgi:hypothetical protein